MPFARIDLSGAVRRRGVARGTRDVRTPTQKDGDHTPRAGGNAENGPGSQELEDADEAGTDDWCLASHEHPDTTSSCQEGRRSCRGGGPVHAQLAAPTLVAYAILGEAAVTHCKTRATSLPQLVGPTIFRLQPLQEETVSYNDLMEQVQRNLFLTYFHPDNKTSLLHSTNEQTASNMKASIRLVWLLPACAWVSISGEHIRRTLEILGQSKPEQAFQGYYNHYFHPHDPVRFRFIEAVLQNMNNRTERVVTACDVYKWPVRFPLIVPCAALHLVCTECAIAATGGHGALIRKPLAHCSACGDRIHSDFCDCVQVPVEADFPVLH